MRGIIILCEGRHDVAFFSILLEKEGYHDYKIVLKDMESPLSGYFIRKIKNYKFESYELMRRPILPWIMYKQEGQSKDKMFVLLFSMDGLDKTNNYKEIINDFSYQAPETEMDDFADTLFKDCTFSLAFILDADKKGIDTQIKFIQNQFREDFPKADLSQLGHGKDGVVITNKKRFKSIGCYVMTKDKEDYGNLEDILLPIMEKGNQKIFNDSEAYLSKHNFERTKTEGRNNVIDENKTESDFKKSKIGIAGQLDCSGQDNTEIILKSRFLKGKIDTDKKSKEIIEFINELRAETKK